MTFTLTIKCDNAAFTGVDAEGQENLYPGPELARILEKLASQVENAEPTGDSWRILDFNGNKVGEARLE